MKKYATAFIIGSSLVGGLFTLANIGYAQHRSGHPIQHYEWVPFAVLPVLGIGNMLNYWFKKRKICSPLIAAAISGALTGIALAAVGRYTTNAPMKIFGYTIENRNWAFAHSIALYVLVFLFVMYPLNSYVIG